MLEGRAVELASLGRRRVLVEIVVESGRHACGVRGVGLVIGRLTLVASLLTCSSERGSSDIIYLPSFLSRKAAMRTTSVNWSQRFLGVDI